MIPLDKISQKTGLTQTELKVNAFLIIVLFIGILLKSVGWRSEEVTNKNFDYTYSDSIFYAADLKPTSVSERTIKTDSQIKSVLKTKSINLNSATMDQLTMIPGIGPKTALNILEYRKEVGRFSSINQLLEVKGIANSKFEKIKNFVYVQR